MISLDTEDTGVDFYHGARPFFVTLCRENGEQRWWGGPENPWPVDPLTRRPDVSYEDLIQIQSEIDAADRITGHNIRFDVKALSFTFADAGLALHWPWEKTHDTLIAGHLLASNRPHNLTDMVMEYLNYDIEPLEKALEEAVNQARRYCRSHLKTWRIANEDDPELPSAKEKTWRFDYWLPMLLADRLGYSEWLTVLRDYSNADSATSLALWKVLEKQLHERHLWKIYKERLKLLPIALELENRGVTVNQRRVVELLDKFQAKLAESEKTCVSVAKKYNYDLVMPKGPSSGSLNTFVFDVLKLSVVNHTKKTYNPSFDSKIAIPHYLDEYDKDTDEHLFVKNVAKARKRKTSLDALNGYLRFGLHNGNPGRWLQLHTSANPTGTDTLRWSFKQPNTSNVSKQEIECLECRGDGCDECNHTGIESFNLRYCFGPAAGREWWAMDYQNLELRIPAYESGERKMIDLFERAGDPPYFGSYHLLNCSILYPDLFWPLAEQKGEFKTRYAGSYYTWGKSSGLALQYGCQARKFDQTARREGGFYEVRGNLSELFKLADSLFKFADRHGYVETIPDREVDPAHGYPILVTRTEYGKVLPTVPLAYHVQSTAMQCTNKAMIRWDKKLREWQREGFNAFLTMQGHDELVTDMPRGDNWARAQELKRLMEQSGDDIGVPLPVSCKRHRGPWSVDDEDEEPSVAPLPAVVSV